MRNRATHEMQIPRARLDVVTFRVLEVHRNIGETERDVIGREVERNSATLKIEICSAIIVVQDSLLHNDVAGLEIKECIQRMASRVGLRARLRLVGGSVGIDDQVKPRVDNRKVAKENAGTQHTQNVHLHAERVYLGVWRFARCLKAMNDDPAHFCFEAEKIPMERRDLDSTAGGGSDPCDESLANHVFKIRGASPKEEANDGNKQDNRDACARPENVSQISTP